MGPCWFQIVGTHFRACPTRQEIRNVIFVERNNWECSQVAGKCKELSNFYFYFLFFWRSSKHYLLRPVEWSFYSFILSQRKPSGIRQADFVGTGLSTLSTLSSVYTICCRCAWCGPNKDPCAAKAAWRETNFDKSCLILEDPSAGLNKKSGTSSAMYRKSNRVKIQDG